MTKQTALLLLLLAGWIDARASEAARPVDTVTATGPLTDGSLFSDSRWGEGTPVSLQAPSNVTFSKPPEKTQVRVLWNPDFLLVRFDCEDRSIVRLPGSEKGQRDLPYFKADAVEVFLDPVGDGRTYMEFQFTPFNGVFDAIYFITATPHSQPNFMLDNDLAHDIFILPEWNLPGLKTEARIWPASKGSGWSVIAAFPAKEILQRRGKRQLDSGLNLKANFVRFNYSSDKASPQEITNWSPVLGGCAHFSPAGMGTLVLSPVAPR